MRSTYARLAITAAVLAGLQLAGPARARAAEPPTDTAIGIGIGYDFPAGLDRPDVASVRFRLASGLTFEPFVTVAFAGDSSDPGGGGSEVTNSSFELGVGTTVRFQLATHGGIELVLLGSLGFDFTSNNPDGDDNNSSSTVFGLNWGMGLDYWVSRTWVLSFSATNPLVSVSSSSQDQIGGTESSNSSYDFGVVFAPNIVAMLHLFW